MITLYSVISTPEGDTDLYGKRASDLGNFKISKSGAVTGNALYVTGYTGFNGEDINEQEGYYFPLSFKKNHEVREVTMQVEGSKNPPVKMDENNVLYLGKTETTAKKKKVILAHGENRWILTLGGVAFQKIGGSQIERK